MARINKFFGNATCFYGDRINFCAIRATGIRKQEKVDDLSWNEQISAGTIDRLVDAQIGILKLQGEENKRANDEFPVAFTTGWKNGFTSEVLAPYFTPLPGMTYNENIPSIIDNIAYMVMSKLQGRLPAPFYPGFGVFIESGTKEQKVAKEILDELDDLHRRAIAGDKNAIGQLARKAYKFMKKYCEVLKPDEFASKGRFLPLEDERSRYFDLPCTRAILSDVVRAELGLDHVSVKVFGDPRSDYLFDITSPVMDTLIENYQRGNDFSVETIQ